MIMVDYDRSHNTAHAHSQQHGYPRYTSSPTPSNLSLGNINTGFNSNNSPLYAARLNSPHLSQLDRHSPHSTPSPTFAYAQPPLPHLSGQQQPLSQHHPQSPHQQQLQHQHQQQQHQHHHQHQQGRQSITSYPSPGSYPSPSMSSYSPYTSGRPGSQVNSPTYASAALPAPPGNFSLPPIRLAPPGPPPTSSPVPQHIQLGSPLPQPSPTLHNMQEPPRNDADMQRMQNYYAQMFAHVPGMPRPIPGGDPNQSQGPLRYPLPSVAQPERIMSGGRHKKEIKRRTKTGCLTCRKRRIKCDEAHPSCKNCAKSKRDCLGYDPIFKTQPGPAAIQPAPSNGPQSIAPYSGMMMQNLNQNHQGHQMHGQGQPPMGMQMQMQMPMGMQGHMPTSVPMGYAPAMSSGMSNTGSSPRSVYDYDPYPVDPALESAILPPPHSPSVGDRLLHDTNGGFRPDLKRSYDRASPFSSTSDTPRSMGTPVPRSVTPGASNYGSQYGRDDIMNGGNSAKRIKINDLLTAGIPPPPTPPPSEHYVSGPEGTRQLFRMKYAPAFDQLLETGWYENECYTSLLMNSEIVDLFAEFLDKLKLGETLPESIHAAFKEKGAQDGVILYNTMRLIYGPRKSNNEENIKVEDELEYNKTALETLDRVRIVEALILGEYLEPRADEASKEIPHYNPDEEQDDKRAANFWALMRRFLTLKEDGSASAKDTLETCRGFLDHKESRDILYAIAQARHLGAVLNDTHGPPQSPGQFRQLGERLQDDQTYLKKTARSPVDAVNCVFRRVCARAVTSWGKLAGENSPSE